MIEAQLGKDVYRVVLDVNGVGYEVLMPRADEGRFPLGEKKLIFICESVTAYDGATTLYGFDSKEEKELFVRIRDHVGGMGPKKALDCIDKIKKSLPDFKRAVIEEDVEMISSVFGFTKKTAEKLVFSLKGKMETWSVSGKTKWTEAF